MVGSIEEDKNGNLWLGTNAGLVKLGAQSPGRDAVVRVYTEVDGLQGNFFISRSACSRDGELFFGGYRDITVLFLKIWKKNREMSRLQSPILRYSTVP